MKFTLTADQISTMIADGVAKALASQGASPQPASPHFLPKGSKAAPSDLADKDRQIAAAFARKGFKVTLMDRNDPKLPYDVRPYKGWLQVGRVVRKGQRGIRGLFHLTQTDALPSATPPKGKKAKPQLVKS
jgi:hypothetical protein